jgi:hypothetical protein
VPRTEWVLTPPGGNLSTNTPCLNDCAAGAPLRLAEDGSLPSLPGAFVQSGEPSGISAPPQSLSFMWLGHAGAPACS